MSAATWDQPDAEPAVSGTCARCQQRTDAGRVHWVPRNSAPDARLIVHADPDECIPQ